MSSTSTFDPSLLEETIVDVANATSGLTVPEGEFTALIEDYTFRPKITTKFGERVPLDIFWTIDDADLRKKFDRDVITVKQSLLIEVNEDESLSVGPVQNAALGRLRAALNMNGKGFSFLKLKGAGPARVLVSHRVVDADTFSEIKKVVPMA